MPIYTHDNTDGYSDDELQELNDIAESVLRAHGLPERLEDCFESDHTADAWKKVVKDVEQGYDIAKSENAWERF